MGARRIATRVASGSSRVLHPTHAALHRSRRCSRCSGLHVILHGIVRRVRTVNTITSKKKIVSSSLRIRKAEEFSTFYYYTKQQLKKKDRQLQRERKNIIKSKSDAHLRHYAR